MKIGQRVRCTGFKTEELPKYLVGKKGTIVKKRKPEDGVPMCTIKFDCREKSLDLWVDEFVAI